MPPSITTFAPIIKLHSSDDINKAALAISSDEPKRLIGCNISASFFAAIGSGLVLKNHSLMGVKIYPGDIEFILIPLFA